jgi:FKBP-type peptidyl-prolyl cis-trans isomerase
MFTMVKKYYESKTPAWQRWMIWIIAIAMAGGTILTYVVILIANDNTEANPTQIAYNKYLEDQEKKQQAELDKAAEAQAKYVAFNDDYQDKIGAYEAGTVTELRVETLKEGDGAVVKGEDTISANYTGWDASGQIFDTTRKTAEAEATPISFSLQGVITGWTQGLTGKKVGGIYLLEIPTELAYGADAAAQGRPAGPLKFLVEIKEVK